MKIYTCNIEDYLSVLLGLCGELDAEAAAARAPVLKTSTTRGIKSLKDARVLIRHRYDDGRKYLRLSSVNGGAHLSALSPDLELNARKVVSGDLKYSGGKAPRMRDRINSDFYFEMVSEGVPLNGMSVSYIQKQINDSTSFFTEGKSVFGISPDPSFEEIAAAIPEKYTGVFTKRLIKERFEGAFTRTGSRTSRISALLLLNGIVYKTYVLQDPEKSAWKPEAEFRASNYLSGTLERECPYYRENAIQIENKSILLFPTPESAGKMIWAQEGKNRIDPCLIYKKSYCRPAYSLNGAIQKLLGESEWEKRLVKSLFPEGQQGEVEDLALPDGTEVYNFIGCNINRIRFASPRIHSGMAKSLLLCEEWMEPYIKDLFCLETVEIVTISDSDLELLTGAI